MSHVHPSSLPLSFLPLGTRGQSLKEDWIAYICREILRVRCWYILIPLISVISVKCVLRTFIFFSNFTFDSTTVCLFRAGYLFLSID